MGGRGGRFAKTWSHVVRNARRASMRLLSAQARLREWPDHRPRSRHRGSPRATDRGLAPSMEIGFVLTVLFTLPTIGLSNRGSARPSIDIATPMQQNSSRGVCILQLSTKPCEREDLVHVTERSHARPPLGLLEESDDRARSHARGRPTWVGAWSACTCLGVAPPGADASAVGLVAEGSPTDRGRVGCRAAQVQRG